MARSITSANSSFTLAVTGVFSSAVNLQGYAVDDMFSIDPVEVSQNIMGADGKMSSGFVYNVIKQKIVLQADSPSNDFFETWRRANQAARDVFFATGMIFMRSVNKQVSLTKGSLELFPPISDAKKVLQARSYTIAWERVEGTVLS